MKPTKVKAWPELIDFLPAIPVLTDSRRDVFSAQANVEVDFGSVRSVSSSGLTVFLLQLLRFLGPSRCAVIRHECREDIRAELERLGAFELLINLSGSIQPELIISESENPNVEGKTISNRSLPLYRLRFDADEGRRKTLNKFIKWLTFQLPILTKGLNIETNGFLILLNEIAKNSADHAKADALFGIDITSISESRSRLTFAFGDFGIGIKEHIAAHLPPEIATRKKHMSLYEAYRLALKPGYTSNRSNGLNKGHGMSIIIDVASTLGIHLSVFDAWSRGLLTTIPDVQELTHEAIRRIFHNIGHDVGFFYYGEIIIDRDTNEN